MYTLLNNRLTPLALLLEVLGCFFNHRLTPFTLGDDTTHVFPSFPLFVAPDLKSFAEYGGDFRLVYFLVNFLFATAMVVR